MPTFFGGHTGPFILFCCDPLRLMVLQLTKIHHTFPTFLLLFLSAYRNSLSTLPTLFSRKDFPVFKDFFYFFFPINGNHDLDMNTCTQKLGPMGLYKQTAAQQGHLYKWMELGNLESATDFQCLTILCLFCLTAESYVGRGWTYDVLHNDKPEL